VSLEETEESGSLILKVIPREVIRDDGRCIELAQDGS
jgi:hypothetical protein